MARGETFAFMIDIAQTIAGEASVCPVYAQALIGHMALVGTAIFYGSAVPSADQIWIANNLDWLPKPDPMPIHVFSDEDMRQAKVRALTVGRRIERIQCRKGLGLNFIS